jgi:hypothetical protein
VPASLIVLASRGDVFGAMLFAVRAGKALDSRLRGNDGEVGGWRFFQREDAAMRRVVALGSRRFDEPRTSRRPPLVIPESRSDIRDPAPLASRAGKALDSRLRGNDGEVGGWRFSQGGDVAVRRVVFDETRTLRQAGYAMPGMEMPQ